jgi:hypothetical protein
MYINLSTVLERFFLQNTEGPLSESDPFFASFEMDLTKRNVLNLMCQKPKKLLWCYLKIS